MSPLRVPALLLALLAPLHASDGRERPPLERAGVLELTLPEPDGVRVEWFRLDAPGAEPGAEPLGVARLMRVPEPRGGARLEWDTRWLEEGVRVSHVERLGRDAVDLVRREIAPRGGRTLRVAWDLATNALEVVDVGGPVARRRELDAEDGLCTPLFLVENLRAGRLSAGAFRRLDPSAGAAEQLVLRLDPMVAAFPTAVRLATWRRADGTLAGRYALFGDRILAYQLQAGGPVARGIDEERHAALQARRGPPLSMR